MKEIRAVKIRDYPDYFIREDGFVWSCKTEKFLKPFRPGHPTYFKCNVKLGGVTIAVSRLVASAFIPNTQNDPNVLHADDNPQNNHISNLFWGTQLDNINDRQCKNRQSKGRHRPTAKLTDELVLEIRTRYALGNISHRALAVEYEVSLSAIQNLLARTTWKHL